MRRILVTGGNRGIGLELVTQYLERGDYVLAGCRHPKGARDLHLLEYSFPDRLRLVSLDVTDCGTIDAARTQAWEYIDGIDILFNNAGIYIGKEDITNVQAEDLLLSMHINAVGPILVAQRFRELLKNGNGSRIINMSSEAGSISKMEEFRGYSYFGSKAALNMYTRALAFDEMMCGIISIALHPGWVRTDMGGKMALLTVEESVDAIIKLVDTLAPTDNGKFLTYEGEEYPW